jgi:hypothetical protein
MNKIDIAELLAPHPARKNFNLFWVDGLYTLRTAKVTGTFPWHSHPEADEGWFVVKGKVTIHTTAKDIVLGPGEAVLIPKGTVHAPTADIDNSIVLIVNGRNFRTVFTEPISLSDVGYVEQDVESG